MGVKQSPDIAQEIMEHLLRDLDETDVYIDDVGIFSNSWDEHLTSLRKVLTILQSPTSLLTHSNVNGLFKKQIG
jgi:hypothetical protein